MGHPLEDFATGGLLCWIGQPVLDTSCIGHDEGGEARVAVAGGDEEIDCPMMVKLGYFE
jgi:hypothetical protein